MTAVNEWLFKNTGTDKSWTLEAYQKAGGYNVWRAILNEKRDPVAIIDALKKAGVI